MDDIYNEEKYTVERVVCECPEKPCSCYRFVVMNGDEQIFVAMKYNQANNVAKSLNYKLKKIGR